MIKRKCGGGLTACFVYFITGISEELIDELTEVTRQCSGLRMDKAQQLLVEACPDGVIAILGWPEFIFFYDLRRYAR